MPTTPSRILYASQRASLYISGNQGGGEVPKKLAIQSASLDITNPIDDVLTFGILGSAGRFQKEVSRTKITLKFFPTKETGSFSGILASDIATLRDRSLSGLYSTIVVEPYGFTGSGILTNMTLNAAVNSFVDSDMSFEGLGFPVTGGYSPNISSNAYNDGAGTFIPTAVTPITHDKVSVGYYGGDFTKTDPRLSGTIASAKFSFDLPNEVITSLGSLITGDQTAAYGTNRIVSKPPFKASLMVDGTSATAADTADFGIVSIVLPKAIVISSSYNQGVGTLGATYSYTTEDVSPAFYDSPFAGFSFSGGLPNSGTP
jgi:hypothetical protein